MSACSKIQDQWNQTKPQLEAAKATIDQQIADARAQIRAVVARAGTSPTEADRQELLDIANTMQQLRQAAYADPLYSQATALKDQAIMNQCSFVDEIQSTSKAYFFSRSDFGSVQNYAQRELDKLNKDEEDQPIDKPAAPADTGSGNNDGSNSNTSTEELAPITPSVTGSGNDDGLNEITPSVTEELAPITPSVTGSGNSDGSQNKTPDPAANQGQEDQARAQPTTQDLTNANLQGDWRVRLSLAPGSTYLYNADNPGILAPLSAKGGTNGVVFPYTPTINVTYNANYDAFSPTHSNYKIFSYQHSSVENITIACDFTAQDVFEAKYLLAVIHFFKTVTKMFYGQDNDPKPGTPPPLCFLSGLGQFQFNNSPLLITNFTYNLPADVDYIKAATEKDLLTGTGAVTDTGGLSGKTNTSGFLATATQRLATNAVMGMGSVASGIIGKLDQGGALTAPNFTSLTSYFGISQPTYVPTKINISIGAVPIVSRYNVSNNFSLKDYASGNLNNFTNRGGFW